MKTKALLKKKRSGAPQGLQGADGAQERLAWIPVGPSFHWPFS